jgi:hypothetical protein
MFTTGHVDHFRTFGFTVLRGYLADRVTALRAEADAAIRDGYAASYDERVIDGISGHYLPMASRLTRSARLWCAMTRASSTPPGNCSAARSSPSAPKGSCTSSRRAGTPMTGSACSASSSLSTSMS